MGQQHTCSLLLVVGIFVQLCGVVQCCAVQQCSVAVQCSRYDRLTATDRQQAYRHAVKTSAVFCGYVPGSVGRQGAFLHRATVTQSIGSGRDLTACRTLRADTVGPVILQKLKALLPTV